MTNIRSVLACNMREFRKERGLSQAQLAEKVGTAANYISKIEAERQFPSVPMIEQIAAALGVDSVDLFAVKSSKKADLRAIRAELVEEIGGVLDSAVRRIEESL